ncbi:MAG: helix-turn-helix domain-containing protein [Pseudomonas sp.]|uniref:helix-turn-helix domain-containing protein n=1 Tax=Pseudomonas sp. TaxID=306 RepID=UPI003D6DB288
MNQKKRDLSEWEKSECAALKAAIEEYNRARPKSERITQEQAGAALGMNQGSFSNYLNGRLALNLEFALKVSKLFDIPIERFSPRLAQDIDDISSTTSKASDIEHYFPLPLFTSEETPSLKKVKFRVLRDVDEVEDLTISTSFKTSKVFLKHPVRVESLSLPLHQNVASACQVRLKQLVEKLQQAVEHEQITEKDFDLLESMLDRFMDMGTPYKRESNEHFEKH